MTDVNGEQIGRSLIYDLRHHGDTVYDPAALPNERYRF